MMDQFDGFRAGCQQAEELLDAHALGALETAEAAEVERHVADCLRCSEELSKSQRTAALLAVSVPIRTVPPHTRDRIMAQARRDGFAAGASLRLWRLRPTWRTSARALGLAGVAALAFAAFLQMQMSDLRGDKNELQQQLSTASSELEQQKQIVAVLSASDNRKIPMEPTSLSSQAESVYNWSRDNAAGFIVCRNFPLLPPGSVYQVWFTTSDWVEPVATFTSEDGGCQIPMDMSRIDWRPKGIGISVEPEGGSERPSIRWFAYASFTGAPAQEGSDRDSNSLDMVVAAVGP